MNFDSGTYLLLLVMSSGVGVKSSSTISHSEIAVGRSSNSYAYIRERTFRLYISL